MRFLSTLWSREMRLERLRWKRVQATSLSDGIVSFTDSDSAANADDIGQTHFYRFVNTQFTLARWVVDNNKRPLRVLFAPCSVGCEPYSFATILKLSRVFERVQNLDLTIDAFDISPKFSTLARRGIYPLKVFQKVHRTVLKAATTKMGRLGRYRKLNDDIKTRVNILPAADLLNFEPTKAYDVVMATNIICHLTPEKNLQLARNLVKIGHGNVIVNGFQHLRKKDPQAADAFLDIFKQAGFVMVPHRLETRRGKKDEPIHKGMIIFERAQPNVKPLSQYLNGFPK